MLMHGQKSITLLFPQTDAHFNIFGGFKVCIFMLAGWNGTNLREAGQGVGPYPCVE